MKPPAAHTSNWEVSEVVFGIPLVISLVTGFLVRFPIVHGLPRSLFVLIGLILIGAGIAVIIAARREFARYGQPTDPGKPTSRMVTSGVFSISRNPLYLGVVVFVAGLGLAINSWWVFIFLILEIILCHFILIIPEERYLSATFGQEYKAYMHSVYRWLGRKAGKNG